MAETKTTINIKGQGLKEFPIGLLNEDITAIIADKNEISEFPDEITVFPKITRINFNENQITRLPLSISNLKDLKVLAFSSNLLSELPSSFSNLDKLERLFLGNNKFDFFPNVNHLPLSLQHLFLGGNEIKSIPININQLQNLNALDLNYNKISSLPKELCELEKLTHLDLRYNNLSYLPEEIRNLRNLEYLFLEGNPNLPLPDSVTPEQPKLLINYILRKQTLPEEEIKISKSYIFNNVQLPIINERLKAAYDELFESKALKYELIEDIQQINKNINLLFLVAPYDVHQDEKLLKQIIKKCNQLNVNYHLFLPEKGTVKDDEMNLEKISQALAIRNDLEKKYGDKIIYYKSKSHLTENMLGLMKSHLPKIRIQSLALQNIGHFDDLTINFEKDLTCLVGENGTGKTTIIRAIALGLIGHEHEQLNIRRIKQMLRIHGLQENSEVKAIGNIRLTYTIDREEVTNELTFTPSDDGREIQLDFRSSNPVVFGNNHLKSLILGFPQVHNELDFTKQELPKPLQQPHVEDLIPLINNIDENRLIAFMGWLANLNNEASNGPNERIKNKAKRIIEETFKIVSKIIDKEISFYRVKTITPLDIWIKTADAPNGIPLHLVSQGFKEVIGWIGHLLQRLAEAHPFSADFTKENGVVILDEIDAFTHPKWQVRLIDVLRETFTNIQFIVSTHSPLAILNRNMDEIKELYFDGNTVKVEEHKDESAKIDLATTVLNYFDIQSVLKKDWQEKVDRFYELKLAGENNEELKELEKALDETLIGLPIHDYRYFLFLKFLKEKGINPTQTVEKIDMTEEEFTAYQAAYAEYL